MRKKVIYIFVFVLCAQWLSAAGLPISYYQKAEGKKDSLLKVALHETITGGKRYKYGAQDDQSVNLYTWNAFRLTDSRADGTIWDMYSPYTHYFTYHDRSASGMAIEHSFPKSWWGWNMTKDETDFAYRDLYHLNPSEHRANGKKNDAMPGITDSITEFDNGVFKVGYMKGQRYKRVFEPADYYKGDFARAYFYIVTCYADYHWIDTVKVTSKGQIDKSTCGAYFAMTNDSYLAFQPWLRETLVRWHREDPVSAKELRRQDVISTIQENRNPFIDYPELVEYIWGNKQGQTVQFDKLTYTGSDDYIVPIDTVNSVALPATDVHKKGFTAHWQDAGADEYLLQVFAQDTIGKPDTLITMHGLKAAWINANPNMSWNGPNNTSEGSAGITLGSKNTDYQITISGLTIIENTVLVVRANIAEDENEEASLLITADGNTVQHIKLNFSETYYTIPLPAGAKEIVLSQGKTNKRVCMQQLYVIHNPYVITRNVLQQETVSGLYYVVKFDNTQTKKLYYTITPDGLTESNTIEVECKEQISNDIAHTDDEQLNVQRIDNLLYVHNVAKGTKVQLYDVTGRLIAQRTASAQTTVSFRLSPRGVYIIKTKTQHYKINY